MHAKWGAWVISAAALIVFVFLAWHVRLADCPLVRFDEEMATAFQEHAQDHPRLLAFARTVTHAGDTWVITTLTIVMTLVFLRRFPRLAVMWLMAALLTGTIIENSKEWVGRPRPDETLRDDAVHERNASFPSGHALGSFVAYGGLAYVGLFMLRRRWAKLVLAAIMLILVLLIGWSRVYLRAHWCTDVLGGWALGLCWLSLCIALVRFGWNAQV
jgi:undecaprenyl-diphosphatase